MGKRICLVGLIVLGVLIAPARSEEEEVVVAEGVVVPARTIHVLAQRTGVLTETGVDVGDVVEAGQLLARIDPRDAELEVRAAEIELSAQQLTAGIAQGHAAWCETALAQAQEDLLRVQAAVRASATGRDVLGQAKLAVAEARSAVEIARLESRREELAVKQCEVALAAARLELERTNLVAPFDAVVRAVHGQLGGGVRAWQSPVATLIDVRRLYVDVPVKDRRACAAGTPVHVTTNLGEEDVHFEGRVERFLPVRDPRTGEIQVRILLDEEATRRLLPGHSVDVRIPLRAAEKR